MKNSLGIKRLMVIILYFIYNVICDVDIYQNIHNVSILIVFFALFKVWWDET